MHDEISYIGIADDGCVCIDNATTAVGVVFGINNRRAVLSRLR